MAYQNVMVPEGGAKISIQNGKLNVPDNPIIPFVEGDGTGRDIWRASARVFEAAVDKAYGGKRKIHWMEVYAGEKSFKMFQSWLPDETIEAFKEFLVGIKGPLTTPIGGGYRSVNVRLREEFQLNLPGLDPLPKDEHGVDVARIWHVPSGTGSNPSNSGGYKGGRYWDRTSDPCRVKAVLSR